ncbi:MAG: pseudouridine-5'-phosphate glycosidase [Erysipelothrix sp.]|jgi:pseudouridine-5'-phosphate glycosidase|nr:pseudouridine-5'-phosphate glycosidase [Erysipelothrix sp.]
MFNQYIDYSDEVLKAKANNQPLVALESTIISHGMPYPQNIEMANHVESIIRDAGAVPATIAIIDGRIKIGLNPTQLKILAQAKDVLKVSRKDIPFVLQARRHGATTVAATMVFAKLANIKVFATGGIGGVHRGAETSFDISADLFELAHTDVAVVCAGAKSILDIGLTLEYLETHGVPVIGYQSDDFPAFYTTKSGYGVDVKLETPHAIAKAMKIKWDLGLHGGLVIANPIPKAYAMDPQVIDAAITQALALQKAQNITGKATTPFLLAQVKEITGGDSLESNMQLVFHNAHLAAQIASAYQALQP